jgi:predicted DNA-binding transcriptional regulator AlpA
VNKKLKKIPDCRLLTKEALMKHLGMEQADFERITNPKHPDFDPDFPKPVELIKGKVLRYNSIDINRYIKERERFCNRVMTSAHACLGGELMGERKIVEKATSVGLSSGVYFLIKDDEVVYVGQSRKLLSRLGSHVRDNLGKFDSYCYIKCDEGKLDALESLYIHLIRPKMNYSDEFEENSPMRAPLSEGRLLDMLDNSEGVKL